MATQCKLYRGDKPQVIPPGEWTLLTFEEAIRNDRSMARSLSLIVPKVSGDFVWSRNIRWAAITLPDGDARPRQFMSRFVRDPLGEPDDTGAADHPVTPGRSWETTTWQFYGKAGVPVGVQVWHDHHTDWPVEHAQFVGTTWDY
ncbi:hypothetical protein ACFU96_21830 [Streptomyces sp. NPDC057620]|uniref:hypothetical protein n=1 Tax=Streptomyces sp. NPDC057620 TaxID=3346185 RepID=UPI0036CC0F71